MVVGVIRLLAPGDVVRVVLPGHQGWTQGEVVRVVGGAVEVDVGTHGTYLFDPDDVQLWRRYEAPTGVGLPTTPANPPANPPIPSCGGGPAA